MKQNVTQSKWTKVYGEINSLPVPVNKRSLEQVLYAVAEQCMSLLLMGAVFQTSTLIYNEAMKYSSKVILVRKY